jgi:hypothetical protein
MHEQLFWILLDFATTISKAAQCVELFHLPPHDTHYFGNPNSVIMENCRAQWKPQQSKPFFQESKSMVENQQSIGSLLWQISRNKEEENVF